MESKEKIIADFLKNSKRPVTIKEIVRKTKTSYPTALFWVRIFYIRGWVEIDKKKIMWKS